MSLKASPPFTLPCRFYQRFSPSSCFLFEFHECIGFSGFSLIEEFHFSHSLASLRLDTVEGDEKDWEVNYIYFIYISMNDDYYLYLSQNRIYFQQAFNVSMHIMHIASNEREGLRGNENASTGTATMQRMRVIVVIQENGTRVFQLLQVEEKCLESYLFISYI